jgi:GxxExxY protein
MSVTATDYNHITGAVLNAAIEVHRTLGAGLLESSYMPCLEFELSQRNLRFERQRAVPLVYKSIMLGQSYRIDLIVEGTVIVEVKSVATLLSVHEAQILTYMKLANCPIGLLVNFNVKRLMDGVERKVNPHYNSAAITPTE